MNQELISIIVPVYNIKDYLPRCVESLQKQTYENIEILLVDDGSTDGTGALCDELAAGDERIRVFHKENGGSSSARNLGIEKAKGAYLAFVDSDDFVSEEMYALLYAGIQKYRVSVAQIGRDELAEDGSRLPDVCIPPKAPELISEAEFLTELLMHRGDCSFCTKLFRRELFEKRRFPVGALNEDFRLLIEMLPQIQSILSLPQQTYHVFYRMGSNTRTKTGFSRVYEDIVENSDWIGELVEKQYPALKEHALRFAIYQRIEYMLHIPIDMMNADNRMYQSIIRFLRRNWWKGLRNGYLTKKNKCYLIVFAICPKMARKVHKMLGRAK